MYMPTGQWGIHQFIYNYMNLAVSGNSLPSPIQIILQCTVYSCFDKGCPTNLKRMPQCRLIVIEYHCLIEVHGVSARRKGKHEYTCLCYFLLLALKHFAASIKTPKTIITRSTFQHYCVRLYAFVGQPFSKQLFPVITSTSSWLVPYNLELHVGTCTHVHGNACEPLLALISIWRRSECLKCPLAWLSYLYI